MLVSLLILRNIKLIFHSKINNKKYKSMEIFKYINSLFRYQIFIQVKSSGLLNT
jgi:hypothetical protein